MRRTKFGFFNLGEPKSFLKAEKGALNGGSQILALNRYLRSKQFLKQIERSFENLLAETLWIMSKAMQKFDFSTYHELEVWTKIHFKTSKRS